MKDLYKSFKWWKRLKWIKWKNIRNYEKMWLTSRINRRVVLIYRSKNGLLLININISIVEKLITLK